MTLVVAWLTAFAITVGVELVVVLLLLRAVATLPRRAMAACFAQMSTHPAVWFVFPLLGLGRLPYLAVAEGFAVVVETLFYRFTFQSLSWWQALATSALANAASYSVGLLLA